MSKPKVSVILTYLEKPLPDCVESIKSQSYKNIELIMGTEKDFGFRKKKGVGFMRNFLSKKATGDILLFMDSDALMMGGFVESVIEIFKKEKPDAISGLPVAPRRCETDFLSYLLGVEYESRIRDMGEGFVSVAGGTCLSVKKEVFDDIGGFVETKTFGEDWFFSQVAEQKGYKIWHTNEAKVIVYKWESFWKYLKKQYVYAKYRIFHAKKFKHTTDEYPLLKTDFSRYNLKEKIVFPFFWLLRFMVWILGAISGVWRYVILEKGLSR